MTALLILANLFLAGILAGEELVIRFGVRGPLARLAPEPHVQLRQGLIRTLRVLVPAIYLPTLASGLAVTLLGGAGPGLVPHLAALAALLVWLATTLGGTVPINQAVLDWDAAAPPEGWRALIARWERLDSVRAAAATAAFALLLISNGSTL